jgi:hypothetical protein
MAEKWRKIAGRDPVGCIIDDTSFRLSSFSPLSLLSFFASFRHKVQDGAKQSKVEQNTVE